MRGFALWVLAVAAACSASGGTARKAPPAKSRSARLYVTTELKGQIEPCGCTSDPLGDLARLAQLLQGARQDGHSVLYLDGGSTLYSQLDPANSIKTQEELKADLLAAALGSDLELASAGLGPFDLAFGADRVRPPRQAANVPASAGVALEAPRVHIVGGVAIGVFGVVAPEALAARGITASEPTRAAVDAIAKLRADGAEVIVGLAHMPRAEAKKLARDASGIDFLVVGQQAPEPPDVRPEPDRVGDTWLIRPANRGQVVSVIDITVREKSPFSDAIGKDRAGLEIARLDEKLAELRTDLAKWEKDTSADQQFLATKRSELASLERDKKQLAENPLVVPDQGSWFVLNQVRISRGLACNDKVQAAKEAYDKAVGEANAKAAADQKPVEPAEGQAGYVGVEECRYCHKEAVLFWNKTRHAQAWETLEELGKQLNVDCISCHVTGWEKPGGSTLGHNEDLRDVQCENCHGPGSIHVDEDGKDGVATTRMPKEELCVECHSPEHSDTFEFQAYLRDVTGPGHGEKFRAELGDGPTGSAVREAAKKKAKTELGAGCRK